MPAICTFMKLGNSLPDDRLVGGIHIVFYVVYHLLFEFSSQMYNFFSV